MRETLINALPAFLPSQMLVPHAEYLWLAAILIGFAAALRLSARAGLDPRPAFWAGLCGLVGAFALGRLWLVWFEGEPLAGSLLSELLQGDKSVMGAVIGAAAGAGLFLRFGGRSVLGYLDAAAPAAFAGYAIWRVGCLLAGCCFGAPTHLPWGIHYPSGSGAYLAQLAAGLIGPAATQSLAVHPIPLYDAVLALLLCRLTRLAGGAPGRATAVALAGYGAGRFLMEFVRGDTIPTTLGPTAAQLGSIAFVLAGCALWQFGRLRAAALARGTAFAA